MPTRRMLRTIATTAIAGCGVACAAVLGVDSVEYGAADGGDGSDGATEAADGVSDAPPVDAAAPDVAPQPGLSAKYRAAILADAPLAYFRLADTSGPSCRDEIDGGYTSGYVSSPLFGQPGIFADQSDPAVRFRGDGVQVIAGADAAPLDFPHAAPFTLECWLKLDGDGGAGFARVFDDMEPNDASGPSLGSWLLVTAPSALRFERWSDDMLWAGAVVSQNLTVDVFHHVVVTLGTAGPVIYVDTIASIGFGGSTLDEAPNTIPFRFGDLEGTIDEVAIYDHVLSPGQVAAHFNAAR